MMLKQLRSAHALSISVVCDMMIAAISSCAASATCACLRLCIAEVFRSVFAAIFAALQVRQQNAELMAAFHRREQLAAVQEDPEGERSSKGGASGAAAGAAGLLGGTDGGSTPNTGSELGVRQRWLAG
jgi:hypothetical protein